MSADVKSALPAVAPRGVTLLPTANLTLRPRQLLPCLGVIAAILLLYRDTLSDMVLLWWRSQTFAHGFAVLPVCLWLAWRQRRSLAALRLAPAAGGFVLLPLLALAWLLAFAANVQVVAQYAVTAMIPAAVIAMLGWPAARRLAFPLAYLFLAVPFGEVFIPPLIDFTARFTVGALQLTGVPVFRENNNFSIPSGNWSVVEACSGLRYVIASLALGILYAYLNYHGLWRRIAFIVVALLLPILANGLRAYLIVMIGHWSNMQLAVGVDHLVYGWLFFGLVSLLLFWAASFWRDSPPAHSKPGMAAASLPFPAPARAILLGAAAGCVALAAAGPLLAGRIAAPGGDSRPAAAALSIAAPGGAWSALPAAAGQWRAPHAGTPLEFVQSYRGPDGPVSLQVAWYARQSRDAQLLAHLNKPYGEPWLALDDDARSVPVNGKTLHLRQITLQNGSSRLLLWRWYRQSGSDTGNSFLVKLLLAKAKLLQTDQGGAEITISAPYDDLGPPPEARLSAFLSAMLPSIQQGLNNAVDQ
ncbi:exosortase A [Janthinobacterium agaricidamnosum]|uniref:EpsI family protein n=1 Tax=Janthinobacterium agaricidamnosum NBRC 102515 = DSM 9628 TaxID=1349767 RepID=W0V7M7_9BURK|nr:exosortase A [Janthinobacterium agaricidamnosum]CDG83272.1 epsI family protein [Janthinobacterium agaricidamnosum NBRC 102515 = DSM 9628]